MTTYWICHQLDHVTIDRECTRVPYGGVDLYDPMCWPKRLTLVNLMEVPIRLASDPKSVEFTKTQSKICVAAAHRDMECTKTPSPLNAPGHAGEFHTWTEYYEKGSTLLVKGKAINLHPKGTTLQVGEQRLIFVPNDNVLGTIPNQIPPEPDRSSLLRSKKDGRLFGYIDNAWRLGKDRLGRDWKATWQAHGPFDVFTPDGEIK